MRGIHVPLSTDMPETEVDASLSVVKIQKGQVI